MAPVVGGDGGIMGSRMPLTCRWSRGRMRPLGGVLIERGEYAVRLEGSKHVGVERCGEDVGVDERRVPVVGHDKGTRVHNCVALALDIVYRSDEWDPKHLINYYLFKYYVRQQ